MPTVLGILNLSPDSFSDGGEFTDFDRASAQADALVAAGAWAVDIGAVSSNPDSAGLSAADEIARLTPLVEALTARRIPISIDTFAPETQRWAASRVEVLNDIRGFPDASVWPLLADAHCKLVVMHAVQDGRADRRATDADTIVDRILSFFDTRLNAMVRAGISEDRLIVDPGMGFFLGDTPEPSLQTLRSIERLNAHTGRPVFISVSRKSFLGAVIGGRPPKERHIATAVAELYAVLHGAEWIRTHDPRALFDALATWSALTAR